LTVCSSEVTDEVTSEAHTIMTLLPRVRALQPPPREETIAAMLTFLHNFGIRASETIRTKFVQSVFDLILPFTDTAKYTYFQVLIAYRVLMTWFVHVNFNCRQRLVKQCMSVLYDRMHQSNCTMAETAIDFVSPFLQITNMF
jgi:hypothetical protein